MLEHKYLDSEKIKGLTSYKYSSIDNSPLSKYVMHPFWNQLIKLCPLWIAPNVLTVAGFVLTVINGILLTYYDFDFSASSDSIVSTEPIPNWVWLVCAINQFVSYNLDAIDGKQARRTGTSGPLGELMDHGLDSWTAFFIPFSIYSMFGRAEMSCPPISIFFIIWSIFITFYSAHWEKYNTGILYLPWSYDVTHLVLTAMYLITYIQTYSIWKHPFPLIGCSAGEAFELISHFGSLALTVPCAIYNVYVCYKAGQSKKTLSKGLQPLISFVCLFLLTTFWALFSPNQILLKDTRVFLFLVGTAFSQISCRLIVNQMSGTLCDRFNWTVYVTSTAVAAVFIIKPDVVLEQLLLRGLTLVVLLGHLHYGVCVVRQLCDHFGIYCFRIGKRNLKTKQ